MNNRNINSNFELKAVSHEVNDSTPVPQSNEVANIVTKGKPSLRPTKQELDAQYAKFKVLWEKGYTESAIAVELSLKRNAPFLKHLTKVLKEGVHKVDDICICHASELSPELQNILGIGEGLFVEFAKVDGTWQLMVSPSL